VCVCVCVCVFNKEVVWGWMRWVCAHGERHKGDWLAVFAACLLEGDLGRALHVAEGGEAHVVEGVVGHLFFWFDAFMIIRRVREQRATTLHSCVWSAPPIATRVCVYMRPPTTHFFADRQTH